LKFSCFLRSEQPEVLGFFPLQALDLQIQFNLPGHLLLFGGKRLEAGDFRPQLISLHAAPDDALPHVRGTTEPAKTPVTQAVCNAITLSIQP
jgi:hypothetical protein